MATFEEEWNQHFKELEERHERGEISYAELERLGSAALKKMETACPHSNATREDFGSGAWIDWCDSCGARIRSAGSGRLLASAPKRKKKTSNCLVIAVAMVSTAGTGIWGLIEAARAIFG